MASCVSRGDDEHLNQCVPGYTPGVATRGVVRCAGRGLRGERRACSVLVRTGDAALGALGHRRGVIVRAFPRKDGQDIDLRVPRHLPCVATRRVLCGDGLGSRGDGEDINPHVP